MYTKEEAEGRRLKNPFDTITEGIGINRVTRNFAMAKLDGAFRGTDMEAVEMARSALTLLYAILKVIFSIFVLFCVSIGRSATAYMNCLFGYQLTLTWTDFHSNP